MKRAAWRHICKSKRREAPLRITPLSTTRQSYETTEWSSLTCHSKKSKSSPIKSLTLLPTLAKNHQQALTPLSQKSLRTCSKVTFQSDRHIVRIELHSIVLLTSKPLVNNQLTNFQINTPLLRTLFLALSKLVASNSVSRIKDVVTRRLNRGHGKTPGSL